MSTPIKFDPTSSSAYSAQNPMPLPPIQNGKPHSQNLLRKYQVLKQAQNGAADEMQVDHKDNDGDLENADDDAIMNDGEGIPQLKSFINQNINERKMLVDQLLENREYEHVKRESQANNIPDDLQYAVDLKLLASLFGDKLIRGTNLADSYHEVIQFFIKILSKNSSSSESEEAKIVQKLTEFLETIQKDNNNIFTTKKITCCLKNWMTIASYYEFLFSAKFWCLANFIQNKQQPSNYSEAMILEKAAHGLANLGRKIYFSKRKNNQLAKHDINRLLELCILCEKALEIARILPLIASQDHCLEPKAHVAFKLGALDSFYTGIDLTLVKETKWKKKKKKGSKEDVTSGGAHATPSNEIVAIKVSTNKVEKSELTCQTPPFSCENGNVVKFFEEWKSYLTHAQKTPYPNIAHYHFENMITSFPLDFDLNGLDLDQKKQLFTTLQLLSQTYFSNSALSDRFRMSINMWHLFFMMSTLCKDILKNVIGDRVNLNEWGVSFPGFEFDLDESNLRCGIEDLLAQKKYVDLLNYVQNFNKDKKFFHFDTLNPNHIDATSFLVTTDHNEAWHDFLFLNHCIQGLANKQNPIGSPKKKGGVPSTYNLDEILNFYANQQDSGPVPTIYYLWREIYFLCVFSQQFSLQTLKGDSKTVHIKHKQGPFADSREVWFEFYTGNKLVEIFFDECNGDPHQLANRVLPDLIVKNFISSTWNQNSIRSVPRSSLFQSLLYQNINISKHEINRMVDIYNSKSEQLSLCLNFYKENPAYLKETLHLNFLRYIFYLYDRTRFSSENEVELKDEIYHFFSNILTVHSISNNDHKLIIITLFGMGLKYLEYQPNQELLKFIGKEILKHFNSSQEEGDKEIYSNLLFKVLAMTHDFPNEGYSNVIMLLLAFGKKYNTANDANHLVWNKETVALLIKLSNTLEDKAARNTILNRVPDVAVNLDQSKDTTWEKSELKLTCQGWTFDLCLGTIRHPDVQALDSILASRMIVKPLKDEWTLEKVLGNTQSSFKLVNGVWCTEDGTVRIIKIKDKFEIQQFIENEWCQFAFYSDSLQQSLPGLPLSFVETNEVSSNKGQILTGGIRWYQPSESVRPLYWGKDVNNKFLIKLEKKGDQWSLEDLKRACLYTTFEDSLPSPLIPLKHFPKASLKTMLFWTNKVTSDLELIKNNTINIYKRNNRYVISGYEDYRLVDQPKVPYFKTLPPFFHLVNERGNFYFLIPYGEFELKKKNENDPLLSVNLPHPEIEYTRFYLYAYEHHTGFLKGIDMKSRIYLSYLYFIDQNYEASFKVIDSFSQQTPYNLEEFNLLKKFYNYLYNNKLNSRNPMQIAIMVKIAFFGIRSESFSLFKSKYAGVGAFINEEIMIDYITCLNAFPKRYRLSKSDIVEVLQLFNHDLINQFKEHYLNGKSQNPPTGPDRMHGAINSVPTQKRTERSLIQYDEDVNEKDKKMLEGRKSILTKYMTFDKGPTTFHFLPTYGGTPAEQLLNKLPIAKQLFNMLREEITVDHVTWKPVDNDRAKLAGHLKEFLKEAWDKKKGLFEEASALKNSIEKEVNSTAFNIHHLRMALERKTDLFAYQKKKLTVHDLAELILGNRWECLLKKNPILSPADLEILLKKMISLMVSVSELRIYEEAENELKSLIVGLEKDANRNISTEIQQIGTILTTHRYTLEKPPLFLAFEFLTKWTLRQTQVDKLHHYLSSENTHQVMKLMMGDGKTKVILPFLSKVIADGDHFPIIIAPASFYEVYVKNMREICEYGLSQRVFTFQFSPSSSTTQDNTKVILNLIKQTIKERGILLITAETMKAVLLKYQELLVFEQKILDSSGNSSGNLSALYSDILSHRQILAEILNVIRSKGTALLDQGHLALNSLTETMSFPIQKLNANEQDIGDFVFAKVLALSGTPYNELAYPAPFQKRNVNEVEKDTDVISNSLTDDDRRLLSALIRGENGRVITAQRESSEAALDVIQMMSKDRSKEDVCCAYIDLGAYLKNQKNAQAAKLIMERMSKQIQGIVFFEDTTNEQLLMHRESGKIEPYKPGILPLNMIGAYFDNVHTYAADIKLPRKGHAIISLNQEVCLHQVLQAVKRMRQLEQSQTISFLVSVEMINKLQALIGSNTIDTSALYMLSIFNEALSVEKQYVQSKFHALKHCMKKKYLDKQLNTSVLNIGNDILVEKAELRKEFETLQMQGINISTANNQAIVQAIEPYQEDAWEFHYLRSPQLAINDITSTWTTPANSRLYCYTLNDFIASLEGNFESLIFDPNILVSRNFARTAKYPNWKTPIKPVDYFVFISQSGNKIYNFLIVTQAEMESIRSQIMDEGKSQINNGPILVKKATLKNPNTPLVALMSIQGKLIAGDLPTDKTYEKILQRALVQMRFFDGREDYSKTEEPILREWMNQQETTSTFATLFAKCYKNREKKDGFGYGTLFKLINEAADIQRQLAAAQLQDTNVIMVENSGYKRSPLPDPILDRDFAPPAKKPKPEDKKD